MTEPGVTSDDGVLPGDGPTAGAAPQQAAHWGFLATVLWAVVIAAAYATAQIGTILALADWSKLADRSFGELFGSGGSKGYSLALANIVTAIVCCGSIVVIVRLKRHARISEYLGLTPVALGTMLRWIGLFIVIEIAATLILSWLDLPIDNDFIIAIYKEAHPAWMLWLALVVAIPLCEEIVFRGFLLPGFAASFLRPSGAVLVTSALWTALHTQYDAVGLTVVFSLGVLFGVARLRTGSLIVPLALHMLENLLATTIAVIGS
jgi:membrane protease YdiL (CAAX protease family)